MGGMEVEEQKSKLERSRPAYKHTVLVEARPHTDCPDHYLKTAYIVQSGVSVSAHRTLATLTHTYVHIWRTVNTSDALMMKDQ